MSTHDEAHTPSAIDDRERALNIIETHFNTLRDQATATTNVWERYEISVILKELKEIYSEIKGGK